MKSLSRRNLRSSLVRKLGLGLGLGLELGLGLGALSGLSLFPPPAQAASFAPALMPRPAHVALGSQRVSLTGMPPIVWKQAPSPRLRRAVARFEARLARLGVKSAPSTAIPLVLDIGADPAYLTIDEKEAYRLDVTPSAIVLSAEGPAGLMHGLATLVQMIDMRGMTPEIPTGHIVDSPRFKWRGIMLDVSRHFMSTDTVKRQLDAMELTKLNVLHWHLSDGTGFRVESHRFPRLQQVGGHNQYYTQAQIRDVIAYASDRGIRIVPEFDIPGHTLAILAAYPALAAQKPVPTTADWQRNCEVASGNGEITTRCTRHMNLNLPAFDPTNPQVLVFAKSLFREMGQLFPDRYFHTGGDEVEPGQWTGNPEIVAYMKAHGYADVPALQAAFTAEVEKLLASDGKIMMGWDEVSEAPIPKNVVVEAWRGSKWIGSATRGGHPVVVSSGYYLDLLTPSTTHYAVDPYDTRADGLDPEEAAAQREKSGPMIDAFTRDPKAAPLTPEQEALVLGGEAPLWTEIVSDEMVDSRLWPRSAAIAERLWSPAAMRDPGALEARLPAVQRRLEKLGLEASMHRARMIARLTPGNVAPLTMLTELTVPVRNYALNRLALKQGDAILRSPAAISSPDSFEASAFNADARRYAAGDHALEGALRERLLRYAGNDIAFQALRGPHAIDTAKPVSQAIAQLARLGLEAIDGRSHGAAWRHRAQDEIGKQEALFAASADHIVSYREDQPPSGLLIAITPGIRSLVDAAR